MSWSIEEHIGECRPWPKQVVVYRGETGECLAYVSGEVVDRLQSENAKLREMCGELLLMAESHDPEWIHWPEMHEELRKLGVKVSE